MFKSLTDFRWLVGLIALHLFLPAGSAASQPNIIFVLADDHRYDALSCLGHPFIKTPNIDRIADDGVIEAGGEDADDSQDDASATSEPSEDDVDNSIQEDRVSDSLSDSGENDSDDDSEGEGLVAGDSEDNDESDADVESTEDDTASDDD